MILNPRLLLITLTAWLLLLVGALAGSNSSESALGGYQPNYQVELGKVLSKPLNAMGIYLDFKKAALGFSIGTEVIDVPKLSNISRTELRAELDNLPDGQGSNYSIFKQNDGTYTAVRKKGSEADQIKVSQDDNSLYSSLNDHRIGNITERNEFDRLFPSGEFPATYDVSGKLESSSQTLQEEAWKVYQNTSTGTQPIAMGRLRPDVSPNGQLIPNTGTQAAADNDYQTLGSNSWSPQVNNAWVQGGTDARREFTVTSHTEWSNLRSDPKFDVNLNFLGRGDHPKTIFTRELLQLRDAGYKLVDGEMVPPN